MRKTAIFSQQYRFDRELAFRSMRVATAILITTLTLAGCAIGKSDFACSGIPEGVSCMSASQVYEASKQTNGPVTGNPEKDLPEAARAGERGQKPVSGWIHQVESGALPLRTPSRVMRIWVAPWEGEDADLHLSTLVYTEIESRRWMIGNASSKRVREITPLKANAVMPSVAASPTTAARPSSTSASNTTTAKNVPLPYGANPAAKSGAQKH